MGGPRTQCVCVGVGGGTPGRRKRRAGGRLTGASAGRAASESPLRLGTGEKRDEGEGTDSLEDQAGVNVAKPLGAPCGTHNAGRRRSRRERRGRDPAAGSLRSSGTFKLVPYDIIYDLTLSFTVYDIICDII
jgi:hypothetical protein